MKELAKFYLYIMGIIILLICLLEVFPLLSNNMYAIQSGSCPNENFLWQHTYDHRRFIEQNPSCVILKGIVNNDPRSDDGDGDLHFNVTPDNGYKDLMNSNNTKGMVVEIICWVKPTASYIQTFGNYCQDVNPHNHIAPVKYGEHIQVVGKWVKDIGYPKPDHPQWREIHPVENIINITK